jgi:hypothetical protein
MFKHAIAVFMLLAAAVSAPAWAVGLPGSVNTPVVQNHMDLSSVGTSAPTINIYAAAIYAGHVFFATKDGGWEAWSGAGEPPAYDHVPSTITAYNILLLDGSMDVSPFAGAQLAVGYGKLTAGGSAFADMLQSGQYQIIYTVQ